MTFVCSTWVVKVVIVQLRAIFSDINFSHEFLRTIGIYFFVWVQSTKFYKPRWLILRSVKFRENAVGLWDSLYSRIECVAAGTCVVYLLPVAKDGLFLRVLRIKSRVSRPQAFRAGLQPHSNLTMNKNYNN